MTPALAELVKHLARRAVAEALSAPASPDAATGKSGAPAGQEQRRGAPEPGAVPPKAA
jgi:hypothetical protein